MNKGEDKRREAMKDARRAREWEELRRLAALRRGIYCQPRATVGTR